MSEYGQVVAVCALIVRGDRVLCMRRSASKDAGAGSWETLSGRVVPGEEPRLAMIREIEEECGLEVELAARPFDAYAARRGAAPMVVIVYRATYLRGSVALSHEHDQFAWLTAEEFAQRSPYTRLAEAVDAVLSM